METLRTVFGDRLKGISESEGGGGAGHALATVSPVHADEVRRLAGVAARYSVPLVAVERCSC
jgi:hypothetical protein